MAQLCPAPTEKLHTGRKAQLRCPPSRPPLSLTLGLCSLYGRSTSLFCGLEFTHSPEGNFPPFYPPQRVTSVVMVLSLKHELQSVGAAEASEAFSTGHKAKQDSRTRGTREILQRCSNTESPSRRSSSLTREQTYEGVEEFMKRQITLDSENILKNEASRAAADTS